MVAVAGEPAWAPVGNKVSLSSAEAADRDFLPLAGCGTDAGGTGWNLQGSDPLNWEKPCNHVWEDSGSARESVNSRTGQDRIIEQKEDSEG